jgi:GTP-binding protein
MHIKSVEFAGAIGQIGQEPPAAVRGLPQIAFAGRSNVGKSSLINRLLGRTRTQIARVSQQPGKTQEINFYRVRADVGEFCLVDFPGYGYARAPKSLRERWRPLISGYLANTPELAGVVQLIDLRHGTTADDLAAIESLADANIPVLFVLTKSDKLKPSRREAAASAIVRQLGISADQAIAFSALSGEGREAILDTLAPLVTAEAVVPPEPE